MCCVQALHAFKVKYGALPRAWSQEDAGKFVEIAKEVNSAAQAKVRMGWSGGESEWRGGKGKIQLRSAVQKAIGDGGTNEGEDILGRTLLNHAENAHQMM